MRLLVVLLSCAAVALAAQKSYEGYKVFSVQLENAEQLEAFMGLQKYEVDFWDTPNKDNRPFRVMVQPDMVETVERFMGDHEIHSDIIIDDAEAVLSQERARNAMIPKFRRASGRSSVVFDHYFRFDEITDFLQDIAADYPNLVTLESGGKSSQGRDVWVVKISNSGFDGSKPVIFMDANIHAREWIAGMSTLNLIHELAEHQYDYPDMLAVDWMIIPMANPDGYEMSHTGDRMWRKTMSENPGTTCLGTDPNRNFAYKWEVGTSTSDNPCSLLFRGPSAESEPEVRIISNLLRQNKNIVKLYLAVHSYGDYLLYPFGYDFNVQSPHETSLINLGNRVRQAILGVNPNRPYTVGNSAHALYPASGASDDFAAGEAQVDHSYCVELSGGGSQGFDLPPSEIQKVSGEIFAGYREYATWVSQNF